MPPITVVNIWARPDLQDLPHGFEFYMPVGKSIYWRSDTNGVPGPWTPKVIDCMPIAPGGRVELPFDFF